MANPQTLCWDCRNSTEKDCEWARYFKPVDGWEAIKRTTKHGETTYVVIRCPKFIRDSWHYGTYRTKEEFQEYLHGKAKREREKEEKEKRRKENEQDYNYRQPDGRP